MSISGDYIFGEKRQEILVLNSQFGMKLPEKVGGILVLQVDANGNFGNHQPVGEYEKISDAQ